MKLTEVDIKGFGKLKNLRFQPGSGLNIVYGSNEAGKSTLLAFIRAMFYGLKGGRKSKEGFLPPLKQYTPWDGEPFAGVVFYTLDSGEGYRIGRNFSKGTVKVYDAASNDITSTFPLNRDAGIGILETHAGLDEQVFDRTISIRQLRSAVDEDGKKLLIEKLANYHSTGSEDQSLGKAVLALEKALHEEIGTEKTSTKPLNRLNQRLKELEAEKEAQQTLHERMLHLWEELAIEKEKLNILTREKEALLHTRQAFKSKQLSDFKESCRKLLEEHERLIGQEAALNEKLGWLMPYRKALEEKTQALHDLHDRLKASTHQSETLHQREEGLNARKRQFEEEIKAQPIDRTVVQTEQTVSNGKVAYSGKAHWYTLVAGVLAIIGFLLVQPGMVRNILLGAAVLLLAATAYLTAGKGKSRKSGRYDQQSMEAMAQNLKIAASHQTIQTHLAYIEQERQGIGQERDQIGQKVQEIGSDVVSILKDAGVAVAFSEIASGIESFKEKQQRLTALKQDQEKLSMAMKEHEAKKQLVMREGGHLTGRGFESFEDLYAELQGMSAFENAENTPGRFRTAADIDDALSALGNKIKDSELTASMLKTRLENAPGEERLSEIDEEIMHLSDKKAALEGIRSSVGLAIEQLNQSAKRLQKGFTPKLNREMGILLSTVTNGRYQAIHSDDMLQVKVEVPESVELMPVERLSSGTMDQVYFCMRLAAVNLLEEEGESLPLFLDEPFAQYDESRILGALNLIKEYQGKRQIFLFTCREREKHLAEQAFKDNAYLIRL